jgi:hypothetical protein
MSNEIPSVQSPTMWISSNPVLISGALYAYVSLVGTIYNVLFFQKYSIDILNYYDVRDYLLSGLRHPVPLAMTVILWLVLAARFYFRWPEAISWRSAPVLVALFYTFFFPGWSATVAAKLVDDCGSRVTLVFKKDAAIDNEMGGRILLGATSNFVFVTAPLERNKAVERNRGVGVAVDSIQLITMQSAPKWSILCLL